MEVYDFGIRLKELRRKSKLTQDVVAEKLGVTRSTISAYERNNKNPTLNGLVKLVLLYNTSLDFVMGINNRPAIYLDDLSESQQKTVQDVVTRLKEEFRQNT